MSHRRQMPSPRSLARYWSPLGGAGSGWSSPASWTPQEGWWEWVLATPTRPQPWKPKTGVMGRAKKGRKGAGSSQSRPGISSQWEGLNCDSGSFAMAVQAPWGWPATCWPLPVAWNRLYFAIPQDRTELLRQPAPSWSRWECMTL